MAIVNNTARRVEIPHESGEWFEIKRLSWRQLELAQEEASNKLLERMKQMGGDLVTALRQVGEEEKNKDRDPVEKYDRWIVLRGAIVKWSYDEKLNDENIEALDEETAQWAFREILSLNEPRTEEETKNA